MRLHRAASLLLPLYVACQATSPDPNPGLALPTGPVDSGFVVAKNGLSFPNFGKSSTGQIGSPEMIRMFGPGVCAGKNTASCKLTPIATKWMTQVNTTAKNGHCEGFAVLSQLMFMGAIQPSTLGGTSAADLKNSANVDTELTYWYATQYLRKQLSPLLKRLDGRDAVAFLANVLPTARDDFYRIGMARLDGGKLKGGHAVTPYAVLPVDGAPNQFLIKVYDNNHPGEDRSIKVDADKRSWEYHAASNPTEPAGLYAGDPSNGNLLHLVPSRFRLGLHECHFCADGDTASADVLALGDAAVSVSSGGAQTGFANGVLKADIPDSVALPIYGDDTTYANDKPVILGIPTGADMSLTLSARGDSTDPSGVQLYSGGSFIALAGRTLGATDSDQLDVAASGKKTTFTPGAGGPFSLAVGTDFVGSKGGKKQALVEVKGDTTKVAASGGSTAFDNIVAITGANGSVGILVNGHGDQPATMTVTTMDDSGTSTQDFPVTLHDGQTVTLLIDAWAGPGTPIPASVDDGNGNVVSVTIDATGKASVESKVACLTGSAQICTSAKGQVCCAEATPVCSTDATCAGNGVPLACDDKTDCYGIGDCCVNAKIVSKGFSCKATCDSAASDYRTCSPTGLACPTGSTCTSCKVSNNPVSVKTTICVPAGVCPVVP